METDQQGIELARDGRITRHNYVPSGYVRLTRGVYGPAPAGDGVVEEHAARRARFEAFVRGVVAAYAGRPVSLYGPTALQMLGVALPRSLEDWDHCHVLVPRDAYAPLRERVVAHRTVREPVTPRLFRGLPLLHPVDHWLQLRGATDDDLIEVGDGLLRRRAPLLTLDRLTSRLGRLAHAPRVCQVRRCVPYLRAGTDSPYETRTRLLLVRAGLPCPAVNLPVPCRSGWTYHVDLGYEAERVAVEYDGVVHVGNAAQMELDAKRRRDLQDEGWLLITVTAGQLQEPASLVASVAHALVLRAGFRR